MDASTLISFQGSCSSEKGLSTLVGSLRQWFQDRYHQPTPAQCQAWPALHLGENVLISSPTGSGKTLAAFVPILNSLFQEQMSHKPEASARDTAARHAAGLQCLYVAPLKALARDVRNNLRRHLRELRPYLDDGIVLPRVGLRTGDTAYKVRRRQIEDPPEMLATTPESLAVLLAQKYSRDLFGKVRWIVVDEVHALAAGKRGADLALSLERIDELVHQSENVPIQRIGLSGTCSPLALAAQFLVGTSRSCTVIHHAEPGRLDLAIDPALHAPPSPLPASDTSRSFLGRLVERLAPEIEAHRTTLIFTNVRSLAEKLTWALRRRYADWGEGIAVHHSSLAPARRRLVERRLKQGKLRVAVSSASLELGIDIGSVDAVVLVHPPGGVIRLLQRVGRSGHQPGSVRRGLVLTASVAELLEATVTAASGQAGLFEQLSIPDHPLDVLCQHLLGMAISRAWSVDEAWRLVRRAFPYRILSREDFQGCLDYLSGRNRRGEDWLPSRLRWEGNEFTIASESTARLIRRNLGTILSEESCSVRLRLPVEMPVREFAEERHLHLGEVDEAFGDRLEPGDRFLLEGRCLEFLRKERGSIQVDEVLGRPVAPRWLGSAWPLTRELARRLYLFRLEAAEALREGDDRLGILLGLDYGLNPRAAAELAHLFLLQEMVSEIPDTATLLMECVPSATGMEYYLHTPLHRAGNDALARVLARRIRQKSRRTVTTLAADLGMLIVLPDSGPMEAEDWRALLSGENFQNDLDQVLKDSPVLRERFGRVAQTGLMVLRNPLGKRRRVGGPDWAARRLFDQIQVEDPGMVLLLQADREVRREVCDAEAAQDFLKILPGLTIRCRTLSHPSPFAEAWTQPAFSTVERVENWNTNFPIQATQANQYQSPRTAVF